MLNIHNCSYHLLLIRTLIFFGSTGIICGPYCLLWWLCIKFGKISSIVRGFGFIPFCSRENKAQIQWNGVSQGWGNAEVASWGQSRPGRRGCTGREAEALLTRLWGLCGSPGPAEAARTGVCPTQPSPRSPQPWASCSLSCQRSAPEFKLNSMKPRICSEIKVIRQSLEQISSLK